eukprot:g17556.t1
MENDPKSLTSNRQHQPIAPAEQRPSIRRPAPHVRPPHDQDVQDLESAPVNGVDLRREVEAIFTSALRGSEVLERQRYIDFLQSIGSTLHEVNLFMKEN